MAKKPTEKSERAIDEFMELKALVAGARALLEVDDGGGSFSEHPISDACEILKLVQARCREVSTFMDQALVTDLARTARSESGRPAGEGRASVAHPV